MTQEEKNNCKDHDTAQKITEWWNKTDEEFNVTFKDHEGHIFYWQVGTVRYRITRRSPWHKLIFSKY